MGGSISRTQINNIAKRDGSRNCHYCNVETTTTGSKRRGTRDHVVPKSLGGMNDPDNYVLACADCNTTRGNTLVYCVCDFCTKVIDDWINDNIWSFQNPMRFKIFRDGRGWACVFNGRRSMHKNFSAAVKAMKGIRSAHNHDAERRGVL